METLLLTSAFPPQTSMQAIVCGVESGMFVIISMPGEGTGLRKGWIAGTFIFHPPRDARLPFAQDEEDHRHADADSPAANAKRLRSAHDIEHGHLKRNRDDRE